MNGPQLPETPLMKKTVSLGERETQGEDIVQLA
jgi:hypothetical protein